MLLPDRLREPGDPEPRECAGFSFNGLFRTREVSIPRDPMAVGGVGSELVSEAIP